MSRKNRKRRGTGRKVLFVVEMLVLLLLVGALFVYTQINKKLDKLDFETQDGEDMEVQVNEGVSDNQVLHGYTNVALFGVDKRAEDGGYGNSDTAIIASINNDTKEIRLVSIYRDTYLRVNEDSEGNGIYNKFNSAYLIGGPGYATNIINTNMDLDIENYVSVDFSAMATAIDCLGGLDVPLSYEEIEHMNNYCVETSEQTGLDYTPIEKPDPAPADESQILDTYHLNGVQATAYCRIRQTASADMGRTERQRRVLNLMAEKAKSAGLNTLLDIMDEVFPMITTNFSKSELISLGKNILSYQLSENTGFPADFIMGKENTVPVTDLDCVIPTTLETNVSYLHEFLFGEKGYKPSGTILKRSDWILEKTGFGTDNIAQERKYLITDREIGTGYDDQTAADYGQSEENGYDSNTYSSDGNSYDSGYSDGSGDYGYDSGSGYDSSGEYDAEQSYDGSEDYSYGSSGTDSYDSEDYDSGSGYEETGYLDEEYE